VLKSKVRYTRRAAGHVLPQRVWVSQKAHTDVSRCCFKPADIPLQSDVEDFGLGGLGNSYQIDINEN